MSDVNFKPCPFCGSIELDVVENPALAMFWSVQCNACAIFGPACEKPLEAIAFWNNRGNYAKEA